jgi:uncharacterized protein (DUF169 family)
MSDANNDYKTGAEDLKALVLKLQDLLKIKTLPIGMKQFENDEDMEAIKGVRWPKEGRLHTTCQLITQSRIAGFTMGIKAENLRKGSSCGSVLGLSAPEEDSMSGERMDGVWFENREAARLHQEGMCRQEFGNYVGTIVSPLRSGRLDTPDIVLFYGTPGQIILFVNGLQWKRYKRYDMTVTGESACSDSWGRALRTRETSISIPCYAERRYGGVADDEMLIAMPPEEFARGVEGLEGIGKVGLRYPIPPYGAHVDPAEGMGASYG